jgi:hypothetical protein
MTWGERYGCDTAGLQWRRSYGNDSQRCGLIFEKIMKINKNIGVMIV